MAALAHIFRRPALTASPNCPRKSGSLAQALFEIAAQLPPCPSSAHAFFIAWLKRCRLVYAVLPTSTSESMLVVLSVIATAAAAAAPHESARQPQAPRP